MATRYKIIQDRWCWCGAPAALLIDSKNSTEPVCSIVHGQMRIERYHSEEDYPPRDTPDHDAALKVFHTLAARQTWGLEGQEALDALWKAVDGFLVVAIDAALTPGDTDERM